MSASGAAAKWASLGPYLKSVLRIVAAFMYLQHGLSKLFAFPVGIPPHGGTVELLSQAGASGILEALGGALLLLGLFTRPVAFILSGEMAVAFFQVHYPRGFWTIINGGELAVVYCFLWLYFSAVGGGPWSIDALRGKKQ